MLHARHAVGPENSQNTDEIWMDEPEAIRKSEKLANLVVVNERNKFNRLFKRDQNNKTQEM